MVANIFGRIYALKSKLNIQNRICTLTRNISRITKNITRSEKQLNSMKRAEINQAKHENNQMYGQQAAYAYAMNAKDPTGNSIFGGLFNNDGSMNYEYSVTEEGKQKYATYQQTVSQFNVMGQNRLNDILAYIEDKYEQEYEFTIQAMKDEQEDMETEKAGLEAQLEIAKNMEQQEKQFASENIKNMFDNRA